MAGCTKGQHHNRLYRKGTFSLSVSVRLSACILIFIAVLLHQVKLGGRDPSASSNPAGINLWEMSQVNLHGSEWSSKLVRVCGLELARQEQPGPVVECAKGGVS